MSFTKGFKETIICELTDDIHIPVPHEYFICSHGLAPTFAFGLKYVYLPTLALTLIIFVFMNLWTAFKLWKKCEYDFSTKKLPTIVSDIPTEKGDLGFLLHLLHHSNKLYVVRFAAYLKKSHDLPNSRSVSDEMEPNDETSNSNSGSLHAADSKDSFGTARDDSEVSGAILPADVMTA